MSKINNDAHLLEIKNLKKYYDIGSNSKLHAVDNITASIAKGNTLGVVGESGCGKTTLGRTILKLIEPTDGEILFEGTNIAKLSRNQMRSFRKSMQIIFQDPYSSLNPRKSVYDIIATPLRMNKTCSDRNKMEEQIKSIMDICGLPSRLLNSYPHELDGGRRQRICIARALVLDPKFIVCDEPVSALDVSIQAQILNLLMDLQEDLNLSYMFVTHDLSVVKHISNNIMVMYLGQTVELATSDELFHNPLHPYTKALLSAIPRLDIESRYKKAKLIRGEVTSPINVKPGCRFAFRCEYRTEECTQADPEYKEISPGHFVACYHVNKIN